MPLVVRKDLLAVEDVYFGFGTIVQDRGTVTLFNAAYLPYTVSQSVTQGLDDRYTKAASDARYPNINGSGLTVFNVANGISGTNAVNFSQLALKADITDVVLKAYLTDVLTLTNSTPYIPLSDYNPATKRYVDLAIINKFTPAATGSFTTVDNKIVTVVAGVITGIA